MESTTIFSIFFSTFIGAVMGKYLFIQENKIWPHAQEYCRRYHTDIAIINCQSDQDQILLSAGPNLTKAWIGLYLVDRAREEWRWSAAGLVTYTNWAGGQPNYFNDQQWAVEMYTSGQWNDIIETLEQPFYCTELIVKTTLSWERALESCKTNRKNLTRLTWDNERLQIKDQMQREGISLVWTGLRFFGDKWQWISGAPLESKKHELSQCPVLDRCGALNSEGLLKSWDCKEELYFSCE